MNDTERDALLRRIGGSFESFDRAARDFTLAATDMRLATNEMRRVAPMVEGLHQTVVNLEGRVMSLENEVRGGVHHSPSGSEIPAAHQLEMPTAPPSAAHLALVPYGPAPYDPDEPHHAVAHAEDSGAHRGYQPPGPMREKAKSLTSEVRDSMRVQAQRAERIEQETAKQTPMLETIVASATRTPIWTALASGAGIFFAYFLATLLQQCQPGATSQRRPLLGPAPTAAPSSAYPYPQPVPSVPPSR